jgi:hypothetical protein
MARKGQHRKILTVWRNWEDVEPYRIAKERPVTTIQWQGPTLLQSEVNETVDNMFIHDECIDSLNGNSFYSDHNIDIYILIVLNHRKHFIQRKLLLYIIV